MRSIVIAETDNIRLIMMPLLSSGIWMCDSCWWRAAFGSALSIRITILQRIRGRAMTITYGH